MLYFNRFILAEQKKTDFFMYYPGGWLCSRLALLADYGGFCAPTAAGFAAAVGPRSQPKFIQKP